MTDANNTAETPIESEEEQQPTADADTDSITESGEENSAEGDEESPDVTDPSRVLRIGNTLNRLLEDLRGTDDLDAAGRKRLSRIHKGVREDLAEVLSDELLELSLIHI